MCLCDDDVCQLNRINRHRVVACGWLTSGMSVYVCVYVCDCGTVPVLFVVVAAELNTLSGCVRWGFVNVVWVMLLLLYLLGSTLGVREYNH